MTDHRDSDDGLGEVRETVAELLATPVGRRWLLRSGLLGAATAAVAGVAPASAAASGRAAGGFTAGGRGGARGAAAQERRSFHFVVPPGLSWQALELRVNDARVPLTPHTLKSRSRLRSKGRLFRKLDTSVLTHYAQTRVPRNRPVLAMVFGNRTVLDEQGKPRPQEGVALLSFHVPTPAIRKVARAAYRLGGSYRSVAGSPQRLGALGLQAKDLASWDEVAELDAVVDTHQTAIALTMLHPDVATIASVPAATTKALLGQTSDVTNLGIYIGQMDEPWSTTTPAVNADGTPTQITVGSTTTTFSTAKLNTTDSTFVGTAQTALVSSVRGVRDTGSVGKVIDEPLDELQDTDDTSTWHQPTGVLNTPTPYTPPVGLESAVQATVSNTGLLYGTYTNLNGSYANGQVPLKLYNNYVRWVWVYVQYLKQDGTNLSVDPGATFPNTPNAQSVGLLPQVFTVLGVPIWDTNTITPTLTFPTGATTARILYAGLGNSAADGGWQQYFPTDAYTANQYAPQKEVLFPALVTGIFTIGVTTLALVADIAVVAAFAALRSAIQGSEEAWAAALDIISTAQNLTAAEAAATTVAAGGATYEDIANNGGSASNIWSILASLGEIIPKVIFVQGGSAVWKPIAAAIVGTEAADKVLNAIPGLGLAVGIISLVGDAATLAEAIGESASSPWLFGNEVSLSYPVSVSVQPDQSLAVPRWPETAVSWRLEATLDGASAVAPLTTAFPAQVGSDPVTVSTSAPFGGSFITWSFVVLDAEGHQVGTAVAKYANDDESALPSTVTMSITELPELVTTGTTFERRDTTSYSSALGGYTWSTSLPADTGTLTTSGVQEVLQVAVSTELAVVAVVWQDADRFWLRGVPIVENGTTIPMGTTTRRGGWARRPYLLFDSFVGASDTANHKLLEPDDTDSGYQLRELTVDPATGDLTWDETVSVGQFLLPVSGAGLHSSGRVAAIHTDSGRFGQVQPAGTPRPPLVAYTAGPGTEIGLLSSPTAVAVTNPGTVLVLEVGVPGAASPAQLSAFDLKGQPVRYFGATAQEFTLPLPPNATYLDMSVDGTGQIYLLSYAGDGSQTADYSITVYTAAGTVITTSPGANAPRLVVDFWRSIYAANYTALIDTQTGLPYIDHTLDPTLDIKQPSISRLDPDTP